MYSGNKNLVVSSNHVGVEGPYETVTDSVENAAPPSRPEGEENTVHPAQRWEVLTIQPELPQKKLSYDEPDFNTYTNEAPPGEPIQV